MTNNVQGLPAIFEAEAGAYAVSALTADGATFCSLLTWAGELATRYSIPSPLTQITPLKPGRYLVTVTTTRRSSNEPDNFHCAAPGLYGAKDGIAHEVYTPEPSIRCQVEQALSGCAALDECGASHESGGDILVAVEAVVRH